MGLINIPREEQEALLALDMDRICELVATALRQDGVGDLRPLLTHCGPYISSKLYAFEQALARHREARAPNRLETTSRDRHEAALDLKHAIWSRRDQVEADRKDAELFFVEDNIWPPTRLGKHLSVRVNYRWRRSTEDAWRHGSILFSHDYDPRPDYPFASTARKLSATKQAQELQKELHLTWDYFKLGALCSVRDFFKAGRDGAEIPDAFEALADPHTRRLNNFSTDFWRDRSKA